MKIRTKACAVCAGVLALSQGVWAADADGDTVGRTCYGCHGYKGASKGAAPMLKGLPASYLEQAMKDYKSGKRPATIMGRIAKGYTDAQLASVAQYFASMK